MVIAMTNSTTATTSLPAGTWDLDVAHSSVSFSVRHMMVSKVHGQFTDFTADIVTAEDRWPRGCRRRADGLDRHPRQRS